VTYDGEDIENSPFKCMVFDPRAISVRILFRTSLNFTFRISNECSQLLMMILKITIIVLMMTMKIKKIMMKIMINMMMMTMLIIQIMMLMVIIKIMIVME
jgi:hypothetical protein